MIRILSGLAIVSVFVGEAPVAAQVTPADSAYYDFWIGEWHRVIDGQVAEEPRFVVTKGLYPSALVEEWQMEGYKAEGWRGWDASRNTWTFVWISERGHFQIWDERKVGDEWYMYRVFVIDDEQVLSRQAFLPQEDGSVIRTSEHSRDGGETWALRFKERYVQPKHDDGARF